MLRIFAALLLAAPAYADPGVVMRVDEKELFVNLGTQDGLQVGSRLDLFRRVTLKHPITGKEIEDRFPIGTVEVTEAGALLSIVRRFDGLSRPPAEGDYATPARQPLVARAPDVTRRPAEPTDTGAAQADPAVIALHSVLERNMGQAPEVQAAELSAWLRAFPTHARVPAVAEAVAALTTQASEGYAATPKPLEAKAFYARHQAVKAIEAGRTLELSVGIAEADVMAVRALVRGSGTGTWTTLEMAPAGDHHWRVVMPPALLAEPGVVEYALEAVQQTGDVVPVFADLLRPHRLEVQAIPAGEGPPGASHADFTFRWVDFNLGGPADRYWQTEARFRYRVDWKALHTVDAGVGLIDGEGGSVKTLDAGGPSESLAMGYAFAAAELSLGEFVGLGGRITGGNHRATDDGTSQAVVGLQGTLRIGDDDSTHLVLGVAGLNDLGSRFFADLTVLAFERLPISVGAEATNLPVDADYGLRLTGDIGWQATNWLTLNLEAGWNARTINHYGFTTGLGLAMDWK